MRKTLLQLLIFYPVFSASSPSCNPPIEKSNQSKIVPVATLLVALKEQENEQKKFDGAIVPTASIPLGFTISGRVKSVLVKEGDHVKKGQLLAVLENDEYSNILENATINRKEVEDRYNRTEMLHQSNSIPEIDYKQANFNLEKAKKAEQAAAIQLKKSYLNAPEDGLLNIRSIEPGSIVGGVGNIVFNLIQSGKYYVQVNVTEYDLQHFYIQKKCSIEIPALSANAIPGKVVTINPSVNMNTYTAKIILEKDIQELQPGLMAIITLHDNASKPEILIPASAVHVNKDSPFVLIADRNVVKKKNIVRGSINGQQVSIKAGLAVGEMLIIEGPDDLTEGQKISIK
ncbi:efflux RND transporter periplasmic adaptor subunit [Chitinophaga sp. 30R24]|uniref:efflux RND transporter periplasmic adaptor subunit n=1 Tax=Chitinophaga sp. 30R24 TaxID=3248838 RepID=UPI003B90A56F